MSLTKDYYTVAELAARQHRDLLAGVTEPGERAEPRTEAQPRRRWRRPVLDETTRRQLAGTWASGFLHG